MSQLIVAEAVGARAVPLLTDQHGVAHRLLEEGSHGGLIPVQDRGQHRGLDVRSHHGAGAEERLLVGGKVPQAAQQQPGDILVHGDVRPRRGSRAGR